MAFFLVLASIAVYAMAVPTSVDRDEGIDALKLKLLSLEVRVSESNTQLCALDTKMMAKFREVQANITYTNNLVNDLLLVGRLDNQPPIADTPFPADVCPPSWILYKEKCFGISPDKANWETAKVRCQGSDAYLAVIDTEDLNNFLKRRIRKEGGHAHFVGGFDFESEGNWRWDHTDVSFDFTYWLPGQPNGNTRQNCLLFCYDSGCRWVDASCTALYPFICQVCERLY